MGVASRSAATGAGPSARWLREGRLRFVDASRWVATGILAASTVVASLAIGGVWWSAGRISLAELTYDQVQDVGVNYSLGGRSTCWTYGGWNNDPCQNVTDRVTGLTGAYLKAANALLAASVAATIGAGLLVLTGLFWHPRRRTLFWLALGLALGAGVLCLGLVGGAVVIGPGGQAGAFCESFSGNATGCSSFWGSTTPGYTAGACLRCVPSFRWGASLAWYLTLAAGAIDLLGFTVLWQGRRGPVTAEEHESWSRVHAPLRLQPPRSARIDRSRFAPGGAPLTGPTGRSAIPFSEGRMNRWRCPACRAVNSPWAERCGVCRAGRPPPD